MITKMQGLWKLKTSFITSRRRNIFIYYSLSVLPSFFAVYLNDLILKSKKIKTLNLNNILSITSREHFQWPVETSLIWLY